MTMAKGTFNVKTTMRPARPRSKRLREAGISAVTVVSGGSTSGVGGDTTEDPNSHTHANYALLDSLSEADRYLLLKTPNPELDADPDAEVFVHKKIKSGYADDAGHADEADKAGNSDKWAGHVFSDYLDQPVRRGDRVQFQAVETDSVHTPGFKKGFTGYGGGAYTDENGDAVVEVDKLLVRKDAQFNTLVINQVTFRVGATVFSNGGCELTRVEELESVYRCYYDNEEGKRYSGLVAGDQVRCQRYDAHRKNIVKYYWRMVEAVGDDYADLSKSDADGTGIPEKGDEIAQFGNRRDPQRQSAIVIDPQNGGSVEVYAHIDSYSLSDRNYTGMGVNPETGEAYTYAYGDVFYGDRDLSDPDATWLTFQRKAGSARRQMYAKLNVTFGPDSTGLSNLTEWQSAQRQIESAQQTATQAEQKIDGIETVIDASALDQNTYYPVTIKLFHGFGRASIQVSARLDESGIPAWATHKDGFTCFARWSASGSGWGALYVNRVVEEYQYRGAKASPIGSVGQMDYSSNEYIYVRGGGKYTFVTRNVEGKPVLHTEAYTVYDQTVALKTSVTEMVSLQQQADRTLQTANATAAGVDSLKNFTDEAFADGIVDRAEAAAIEKYANSVTATRKAVQQSYDVVYGNPLLGGTAKSDLQAAKGAFDTAVVNLLASVSGASADGLATTEERADVDAKYALFNAAYETYTTRIEQAQKYIQTAINTTAQGAYQIAEELQGKISNINRILEDQQSQIDDQIVGWSGTEVPTLQNYPADQWTTPEEIARHENDSYDREIIAEDGQRTYESYKFRNIDGTYQWVRIANSDSAAVRIIAEKALGIASSKSANFYGSATPVPPYHIDDVWYKSVPGTRNLEGIYICNADRDKDSIALPSDWGLVDDSASRLRQMSSDNVISKEEKSSLRNTLVQREKEMAAYRTDASAYGVSITALETAYQSLVNFLTGTVAVNNDTDTTLTAEQRTSYNGCFAAYDTEVSRFMNRVSDAVAQQKVDGVQFSAVNLLDGSKNFTVTSAPDYNYEIHAFDIGEVNEGEQFAVYVENIEVLAGSPSNFEVIIVNEVANEWLCTSNQLLTQENRNAVFTIKPGVQNRKALAIFYAGQYGATAGNSVRYDGAMLVRGNKPSLTWSPSIADQEKYTDEKVDGVQIGGANIFSTSLLEQGAINNGSGEIAASDTRLRSNDFIPITGKDISVNNFNATYKILWLFYDGDKHFINDKVSWDWITSFPQTAALPENAAYVKFEVARLDNAKLTPSEANENCRFSVELGNKPSLSWSPSVADGQKAANEALKKLDDWASDSSISPTEKAALRQQQADIRSEYQQIVDQAAKYNLSQEITGSVTDTPAYWEQGGISGVGSGTYENVKSDNTAAIRTKALLHATPDSTASVNSGYQVCFGVFISSGQLRILTNAGQSCTAGMYAAYVGIVVKKADGSAITPADIVNAGLTISADVTPTESPSYDPVGAYMTSYTAANAALAKYTASTPESIPVGSDYAAIADYYTARQTILEAIAAAAKKYPEELVDGVQFSAVNLIDDTESKTITASATDNWARLEFRIAEEIQSGDQFAISIGEITNLVGNAEQYAINLYNTKYDRQLSDTVRLTVDNKTAVLKVNEGYSKQPALLFVFAGNNGSTAGNSVRFDHIMLVRGNKPALTWSPSIADQNAYTNEKVAALDYLKKTFPGSVVDIPDGLVLAGAVCATEGDKVRAGISNGQDSLPFLFADVGDDQQFDNAGYQVFRNGVVRQADAEQYILQTPGEGFEFGTLENGVSTRTAGVSPKPFVPATGESPFGDLLSATGGSGRKALDVTLSKTIDRSPSQESTTINGTVVSGIDIKGATGSVNVPAIRLSATFRFTGTPVVATFWYNLQLALVSRQSGHSYIIGTYAGSDLPATLPTKQITVLSGVYDIVCSGMIAPSDVVTGTLLLTVSGGDVTWSYSTGVVRSDIYGNGCFFGRSTSQYLGFFNTAGRTVLQGRCGAAGLMFDENGPRRWSDGLNRWIPADGILYRGFVTVSSTSAHTPTLQRYLAFDGKKPTVVRNANGSFTVSLPSSVPTTDYTVAGTAENAAGLRMTTVLARTAGSFTVAFYNNSGIQSTDAFNFQVIYTGDWNR